MATVQLSQRPLLVLAGADRPPRHPDLGAGQHDRRHPVPPGRDLRRVLRGAARDDDTASTACAALWTGYVDLRDVQAENEALKRELQTLQVRLQEERAQAQRTESLRQLLELRQRAGLETVPRRSSPAGAEPEFRDMTIDKGSSDGLAAGHGRDLARGRRRPGDPAERARRQGAAAHRSQRRRRRADRAHARAGHRRRAGRDSLRMEYVPGTADVKPGRSRRHLGDRSASIPRAL